MSKKGIVILTDPESCGLGSADVLVQAVLQVHQLNQAGLATSQAFCDHPAAAMKFIEAYAKAYPELHLQASDLPPPEILYSILADGRVLQLEPPAASDADIRGQASQLTPLYVLSLGAPDTLIQSLRHNPMISSDIRVVDIPPVDRPTTEMVSVADAVAHESHSSSSDEVAAESDYSLEEFSPSEQLSSSETLASVGVDLDAILGQRPTGQKLHDNDQALNGPVTVVEPVTAAGNAGGGSESSYGARTGGTVIDHSGSTMPEVGTLSLAPSGSVDVLGDAAASPPSDLRAVGSAIGEKESPQASGPAPGTDLDSHQGVSNGANEPDASTPTPNEGESGAVDGRQDDAAGQCRQTDPEPELAPKEATESRIATAAQEQGRTEGSSFSAPGEDVLYPPSGSFATENDDIAYPLPPGGWEGDPTEALFGGSGSCDIVDVTAVLNYLSVLSDSADVSKSARPDLELELMLARGAGDPGVCSIRSSGLEQIAPEPPDAEHAEPHHEDAHHQSTPAIHDLDM